MMKPQNYLLTCWLLLIHFAIKGIHTVRIRQLHVPMAIHKGNSVQVHCEFELQHSLLYSVKYYKDYIEFYRYLPSHNPSAQMFNLKGIYVDLNNSNASHVTLSTTDFDSQGTYACEISTEAPDFSTVKAEKQMKVYGKYFVEQFDGCVCETLACEFWTVLPEDVLKIEGTEPTYEMHNLINISCVSGASYPAQTLTWFINDEKASSRYLIYHPTIYKNPNALTQVSKLGLKLTANDAKFRKGLLRLVCQATLTLVYEYETSQTLSGGQQPRNKLLESSGLDQEMYNNDNMYAHYLKQISSHQTTNLPFDHTRRSMASDQYNQDENSDIITWKNDPLLLLKVSRDSYSPLITGGKERYKVGSILNINCSAASDAHLSWYIKHQKANESQLVRYASGVNPCCSVLGLKFRMQNRHFQMQELRLTCKAKHSKTIMTNNKQLNIRTISALANTKLESSGESRNRKLWRIQSINSARSLYSDYALNLVIVLILNFVYLLT